MFGRHFDNWLEGFWSWSCSCSCNTSTYGTQTLATHRKNGPPYWTLRSDHRYRLHPAIPISIGILLETVLVPFTVASTHSLSRLCRVCQVLGLGMSCMNAWYFIHRDLLRLPALFAASNAFLSTNPRFYGQVLLSGRRLIRVTAEAIPTSKPPRPVVIISSPLCINKHGYRGRRYLCQGSWPLGLCTTWQDSLCGIHVG